MAREGLLSLVALLLGALLLGSVACPDTAEPGSPDRITAAALARRLNTPAAPLILDVRSANEYEAGHVPGAVNIPFNELASRLGELGIDESDEVVVYCLSGPRSDLAEQVLARAGYTRVLHLEGQMLAWRQGGYPIE